MILGHQDQFCLKVCVLAVLLFDCLASASFSGDDWDSPNATKKAPLQGEVEESGMEPTKAGPVAPKEPLPVPVFSKLKSDTAKNDEHASEVNEDDPLRAKIERSGLKGHEQADEEDSGLKPMSGISSPEGGVLKGSAQKQEEKALAGEDPDRDDEELQVEWDRWRNRLLRAVLAGAMENLNNPDAADFRWDPIRQRVMTQFPLGTTAWFACDVTNDRRIKTLRLMQSSGYPNYDRAVLDAVRSLEGTSILKFPIRSRRLHVSQAGGVKTSDQARQQYFKFGDVEHVKVPAY